MLISLPKELRWRVYPASYIKTIKKPAVRLRIPHLFHVCLAKEATRPELPLCKSGTVFYWGRLSNKTWIFRRNWLASLNKQFNSDFFDFNDWIAKLSMRKGQNCTDVGREMFKVLRLVRQYCAILVQSRHPDLLSFKGRNKSDFKTLNPPVESVAHRILILLWPRGWSALSSTVCSGFSNCDKVKHPETALSDGAFPHHYAWWGFRAMKHWVGSHDPLYWCIPDTTKIRWT